jgi:D-lactate dehydrogenase (cytochrome)
MVEMLEFNEVDLDCTVQAGLGYISLNEILDKKKCGLWFPLDPGPGASIGGMCACRCSGSTAVRYGSMRENVLNVTAVLADGTIIKTGSRARKSSAGV